MGNSESAGGIASGEEEDVETEAQLSAGTSPVSAEPGSGGGRGAGAGRAPACGLPTPVALLEQVKLREAVARLKDSGAAVTEPVLARNEGTLLRWLEERLSRGEETVTLDQFCEMLEKGVVTREECEEAFSQFDAEGDGIVDVESMLMTLKNSNGATLQGELSHVIRQLQACSLTPGFLDIFSKSKDRLGSHASKILRFLRRNRIPSSAIPFPILEGYNNICTMRSSVMQNYLDFLLQKENDLNIQNTAQLNCDSEMDKVKIITKCYSSIETSSNSADIDKMTNGETTSFWQSDGSARSHWIRLRLKPDVVLRRLLIAVAANDQSYMPQQVTVAVGKSPRSLQEIRDVHIPSNITGFVALLENANISSPWRDDPDPRPWQEHAGPRAVDSARAAAEEAAQSEPLRLGESPQLRSCQEACHRTQSKGDKMAASWMSRPLTGTGLAGVSWVPANDGGGTKERQSRAEERPDWAGGSGPQEADDEWG
ncbi:ZZEF1 protein, partial [Polypterus senegalus]